MFFKEFEIRWNDLDANRHLANSSYVIYMSHTRMAFLSTIGFDATKIEEEGIGPVVFHEHIYYFREILPGTPIRVSLEIMGLSEDGMFFEFHHNFYDAKGRNMAHCEILGGWINLQSRKLTGLPDSFLEAFNAKEKPAGFRILTREDTRKFTKRPQDLA